MEKIFIKNIIFFKQYLTIDYAVWSDMYTIVYVWFGSVGFYGISIFKG